MTRNRRESRTGKRESLTMASTMPSQPPPSQTKAPLGDAVIFLPGLLNDGRLFSSQMNALADKGIQTQAITVDFDSTITGLAAGILARAPETFTLAALSMGGYVAFEVIRRLQIRGEQGRLQKLILMNTQARPDDDKTRANREALIKLAAIGRFKGVTPRLLPRLLGAEAMNRQDITSLIMTMAEEMGRDSFINQQRAILSRPDSRILLPQITAPTLLIGGTEDRLTPPPVMEEIATALPNAQLHILDGTGHLSAIEKADAVTGLVTEFLV